MGNKKKGGQGQQQGDAGGPGAQPRQQGGPPQGGPGPQAQQGGQGQPRGPRGPQQPGGPGYSGSQQQGGQGQPRGPSGPQHQGGPGYSDSQQQRQQGGQRQPRGPHGPPHQGGPGYSGSQQQPQQGGQGQPRGPRGPQHQGGPDQSAQSGPQGRGRGKLFGQGPRGEQGPGPQGYHPPDQGSQRSQPPPELSSNFPAPSWGKKPEPAPQEPPVQQSAPPQPASSAPAEAKPKGKGRGQLLQQPTPAPSGPPTAAPAVEKVQPPPAAEKMQPTPAEAKPGGKKQKGKGQGEKTAPPAKPSPSPSEVGDVVSKTEKMKLDQTFPLPRRKEKVVKHEGGHVAKKIIIEVNYLPLKIKDPQLRIFHYDVNFNPDRPRYLLRKALEKMQEKHFSNRNPAFDGMKNMYVAGKPLNDRNAAIRDSVSVYNHETGKDKEFDVTIKLANDNLNISKIFQYCQEGVTSNIPQTEIQATDIALRSGLTNLFTPAGRSFFARSTREQPVELGGGMELWHGFYQSAIAAWKPYLNIDVANKAFPIEQKVLDYMCREFQCRESDFAQGLDRYMKLALEKFIKGLKISYDMPNPGGPVQKRIYKVTGLGGTPIEERFKPKDNGPMVTVGEYFQKEKRHTIRYPRLPLLKIGTKGSMVPIELCSIIGDQAVMRKLDENQTAEMVRAAARPTTERKRRIDTNITRANYNNNPTLKEFGIEVQTSFEKVEAVVFRAPSIQYNQRPTDVRDGVWRLERDYFLKAAAMPLWGVLNLNQRTYPNKITELEKLVVSVGRGLGINVPAPHPYVSADFRRFTEKDIDRHLEEFANNGVGLVFVVLSNSPDIYGQVKRASELRTGVLTQCIKSRTLDRINPMTVTNILLKVNAKLTGTNHSLTATCKPDIMKRPCMLVGADVTHPAPGPGAEGTPSIAAVAASQDINGFQYKMLYRLQRSREEMIVDLAEIMKEQLLTFFQKFKLRPERIIYFRDGVSEGQFQQVLNVELMAIRKACKMLDSAYEPAITFLVVQKRHHTRFFPQPRDGDRKNCNVPAGTLVDREITHPTEVDFYLVSHQSIQGTARPTKYHLLWDDSDIPQIELEKLTYYLCHMFSRCTRSVSYPAPTYYAHLAAFRARAWWDSWNPDMTKLKQEQEGRGKITSAILDNYPMFFT